MRIIFSIFFCLTFSLAFSQTKSYATVKIANWTLEKFPKHFLIKPARVYTEKTKSGRLTFYQELNEYGRAEGLTVTIQKDYSSPHTVYYYRKGVAVYQATFFDRSTKADGIINKNLEEVLDGPQLKREFLSNNDLQEIVDVYKDGELVSSNRPEEPKDVANFVNGLLEGKFRIANNYSIYEGIAKGGIVLNWKEIYGGTDVYYKKIVGDSIYYSRNNNFKKAAGTIPKRRKITNDISKDGDDDYIYVKDPYYIPDAIEH